MISIKWLCRRLLPAAIWAELADSRWKWERYGRSQYLDARNRFGRPVARSLAMEHWAPALGVFLPRIKRVRRVRILPGGHRLTLRTNSSDLAVFQQVFMREEYKPVAAIPDVRLIVDCGANIGLTSMWLLDRYPQARILAVEPASENAKLCRENLKPYGDRVKIIESGVWPESLPLKVVRGENRDGLEWSIQVRESRQGELPDLMATSISDLLRIANADSIDILKIDIEGAEIPLFASKTESWLPRVRNIIIELHGAECERAVFSALNGFDYELSYHGELTVFRNISLREQGSQPVQVGHSDVSAHASKCANEESERYRGIRGASTSV